MTENLFYLSEAALKELKNNIKDNLSRYDDGDFKDFIETNGYRHSLKNVKVDMEILKGLDSDKTTEAEIKNSLIVWNSLIGITPSLAYEDKIWVHLTHVECLEFTRKRWPIASLDEDKKIEQINTHFFANNTRAIRDLNAISRLWWLAYIANQIDEDNLEKTLNIIHKSSDLRNTLIQRTGIFSRPSISSGIIRTIKKNQDWIYERENYRGFLKLVNRYGGGILFETMNDNDIDNFMNDCLIECKKKYVSK